jgi:hypothetical protein
MSAFIEVERLFAALLADPRSQLTNLECAAVQELIDHREYGLALETLVDIHTDTGREPTDLVQSTVVALADEMAIDPRWFVSRLRKSK